MRISGVDRKTTTSRAKKRDKADTIGDFASLLGSTNKEQTQIKLDEMLEEIDKIGRKLMSTRSVEDARKYKEKIKEYLNLIVKNIYVLKRETGAYNYGVHIRIEVIDKKLDQLTKDLIEEQQESISLASRISEIRGLLVDVYK